MRLASITAAIVAAAVLAAGTGATPSPLGPAPGTSTTNTHPTFTWTLPQTEEAASISIASAPGLAPTGEFLTANIVDVDDLDFTATTWTPTRPLAVGTYWWHVASRGAGGKLYTPAARLTIVATVAAQSIKVQWSGRQFLATLSLKANVQKVDASLRLYAGRKLLEVHRTTTTNFLVDAPTAWQQVFTVPAKVKRGAALRLVARLTLKGSTATATLTKTLRAP